MRGNAKFVLYEVMYIFEWDGIPTNPVRVTPAGWPGSGTVEMFDPGMGAKSWEDFVSENMLPGTALDWFEALCDGWLKQKRES